MGKINIIYKKLSELKPYKNNPRINKDAIPYVKNSIKEFGFKNPIIIDKNNEIICGHTRLEASKELKLDEVPCIIADDLTEEQVNLFRLADNRVSEFSQWDDELLLDELENVADSFDVTDFGFDIDFGDDEEIDNGSNERQRTNDTYNLEDFDEEDCEGFYQMPVIQPINYVPKRLIGFNYMLSTKDKNTGIHFYVDDYQFERVWNEPSFYLEKLAEFDCILSPDFSLYLDMPMAMKIWNIYRSRLIGQLAQRMGIKVIPTVSWCEKETFDFCFDGLPHNSTLSVSTIGVKRSKEAFRIWKEGMDEMMRRLTPKTLLVYGGEVEYDYGNTKVIYFNNEVTERMKNINKDKE